MKLSSQLFLAGYLLLALLFFVGCGNSVSAPASGAIAEPSEEAQYILGKWTVNNGRFGHKIFDFQEDGRVLIEDVESGETIEMTYLFATENSFTLSGFEDFNGAATVNFFEDKMDVTITFEGNIFGELYTFTRLDDALPKEPSS